MIVIIVIVIIIIINIIVIILMILIDGHSEAGQGGPTGEPGDRYRVRLRVSGGYRSVDWRSHLSGTC